MERIDKLLALQLSISRKEAAALVRQGAVTAGGRQVKNAAEKVDPAAVCVRGASIHYTPFLYLLLDKPAGVLTAARDKRAKTVFDCIDPHLLRRGVQPVGRLDKDTTGLLLLTDNGALAHRLLSPKCHVEKRYLARLASMPPRRYPRALCKGPRPRRRPLPARRILPARNGRTPSVRNHPPRGPLPPGQAHVRRRRRPRPLVKACRLRPPFFAGPPQPHRLPETVF